MKSVVVTGATSGIGQSTALDLAAHGFEVIATARTAEGAENISGAAREQGVLVRTVLLDVTDPGSCRNAMTEIDDTTHDGPWALVNNAGVGAYGAFEDVSEADAHAAFETNVFGAARMTRLVLPGMLRRRSGRIVQMSSVAGLVSAPLCGWYSASKFALEALSDAVRMEVASGGIHVSLIEPGFIATPFASGVWDALPAGSRFEAAQTAARRRLITARTLPEPSVVARTIRHALTDRVPKRRYRIGVETTAARTASVAPTAVVEWVMRKAIPLDKG